jgi:leucine dehydrogenase
MRLTDLPTPGYERVVHITDPASDLNAFISIHSTALGPALGGMRMWPYTTEAEALDDANRLARAMTYKAAVAQTGQGGGKAVIMGDPKNKTEAMFLALGRAIEALGGLYIAAEDMNVTVADLETVARETRWVSGLSVERGSSGNPSVLTSVGCLIGIRASIKEVFGDDRTEGRSVAIQGVGAVGGRLAELCRDAGMSVAVCDLDAARARAVADCTGATLLNGPDAALTHPCDVFSPCGRGGILNAHSIPNLRCRIVAGAANNQLAQPEDALRLQQRGILYAPDYVVNAGGVINIACEFAPGGYSAAAARERVKTIATALAEVFRIAREQSITTAQAADRLAESRLSSPGSTAISGRSS